MTNFVVGLDLGATKVEACVLDDERNILQRQRVPARAEKGAAAVIEVIVELVAGIGKGRALSAIGIGTPGSYLASQDRIYGAPNSVAYEAPGFITSLAAALGKPLLVENDANCLALGEYFSGLHLQHRNVLAVIMGTGFGGGMILDGHLYRGALGMAAEIGHMSIDYRGRRCGCGKLGCAEAYLSGTSITARYSERSGQAADPGEIHRRALAGEPLASEILNETMELLGKEKTLRRISHCLSTFCKAGSI